MILAVGGHVTHAADVSGAYYDWKKTLQPERPFLHPYHQTVVMKIHLADKMPNGGCKVHLTFEQALEVIKRLDHLTLGIPKIVYLVGWQHNGHDSKYPDWSVVNPRLKREGDATAADSLKWLMAEGSKYHTTVSLHINMVDAYADSPLWDTYLKNDLIEKDKDGNPIKAGKWGVGTDIETQSYHINYAREWDSGFAQKRIDGLLAMLPIEKAHTIHIDVFQNKEVPTQRKILRYFRDKGVDVTVEDKGAYIGLQPMSWHTPSLDPSIPPSLYCGTPMQAEREILLDPVKLPDLVEVFCKKVVPWYYENNTTAKKRTQPLRDGDDLCYPALWRELTLVAYSPKGYASKTWQLPPGWGAVKSVTVSEISPEGLTRLSEVKVENGAIALSLKAGQGVAIMPTASDRK